MKHRLYTGKIYIDEGYRVFVSYGGPVARQSTAVTFQVKCGSLLEGALAGSAIITTISLDTGTQ